MTFTLKLPARWEVREPNPSVRHDTRTRLVGHRFPIKGGLTFRDVRRLYPEQAEAIRARTRATN